MEETKIAEIKLECLKQAFAIENSTGTITRDKILETAKELVNFVLY